MLKCVDEKFKIDDLILKALVKDKEVENLNNYQQ